MTKIKWLSSTLLVVSSFRLCDATLIRRVWVGVHSGDPFWKEGDPYPTSNKVVNDFLTFTEISYNVMRNAGGYSPRWNSNPIMFGVVESESADLQGKMGPCAYGDTYFMNDGSTSSFGSVFCPNMTTPFWVGHEWGHGYALQSGSMLGMDDPATGTIFEFLSDVLGMTVQILAFEQEGPSYHVIPYNKERTGCSIYGENPGFGYIQGVAGTDESKRWLIGAECTGNSPACPSRDMWDPTCFGAADRMTSPYYLCGENDGDSQHGQTRMHMNAGVGNRFFTLLVDGGNGVKSIGLRKAVRIIMDAVVHDDGTPDAISPLRLNYHKLAEALEKSCQDAIGKPLQDLLSGRAVPETVKDIDCEEVAAAIEVVEMYKVSCPDEESYVSSTTSGAQDVVTPAKPISSGGQENEHPTGKGVRGAKPMSMFEGVP